MLEALPLRTPVDVFLKLNTGMNRLGLAPRSCVRALARLQASRNVGEITLMTHFACADDERGIEWQLERFEAVTAGLELPVSLANSATLLRYPHAARDWVRAGIMLYGASPFADESAAAARTGARHDPGEPLDRRACAVAGGDAVGYGAAFRARRPDAHRSGRVRLCGRLSAPRRDRHAGAGGGTAHPHARPRIHGHAVRGSHRAARGAASAARSCCGAKGCRSKRSRLLPARSATSCCALWPRACPSSKSPDQTLTRLEPPEAQRRRGTRSRR